MANPVKEVLKVNRKTFLNPRGWLDYEQVKQEGQAFIGLFKAVFVKDVNQPPVIQETFEEAMQRLNITPDEIENTKNNYLTFAIFFVLAGVVLIGFSIYMLLHGFLLGTLLSIAIIAVLFAQAFRFHFWSFQIKHRKLGCTFEEWRKGRLDDEAQP